MLRQGWHRSLEGRLVIRLAGLNILGMLAGFVGLLIKSYRIARGLSDEGLADRFVGEFLKEAAWSFPLFAIVLLAVVVLTVRSSLTPVRTASQQAAVITPTRTDLRLETSDIPAEIAPLVTAVNGALDRLQAGFDAQRRFTGDAAHELRTPLAILTAGLEALPASPAIELLRGDLARMTRLVDQLLRVARLDAMKLECRERIDLRSLASAVVEQLAPWAVAQDRSLALDAPDGVIWVRCNRDALDSAIRNLVENAVTRTAPATEVLVRVSADPAIAVIDHGGGIAPADRLRIFERFWRAPGQAHPGAGLGLSIVSEVARSHGGEVLVDDTAGGGATFVLRLATDAAIPDKSRPRRTAPPCGG